MRSKGNPERKTKKQRAREFVLTRGWSHGGAAEWTELRRALPDISPMTLRAGLKAAGVELDQPWRGVEQHTFEELAASLQALTAAYAAGDTALRALARKEVIAAKDRAKFASLSPKVSPDKRAVKAEMTEWMLVWLGDPALFPAWVDLRRLRLQTQPLPADAQP